MPRVTHFDIQVPDAQKAIAFYQKAFQWTFQKWEGPFDYWFVITGDDPIGINGGLTEGKPNMTECVLTIDINDLDIAIAKGVEYGGTIVNPRHAIPGVGWIAYIADPFGNVFGLMQEDTSAA